MLITNSDQNAAPLQNINDAAAFLAILDPTATVFQWQTFDDVHVWHEVKNKMVPRAMPFLARTWSSSLADAWPTFLEMQARGAGVYVTINETDGKGRKAENIVRVRGVWHEDDGPGFNLLPGDNAGAIPQLAARSSVELGDKTQRVWCVSDMTPEQHAEAMRAMVARGSDPNACDLSRVLRLPGTLHLKRKPFLVHMLPGEMLGDDWGAIYTTQEIARAYPAPVAPTPPERPAVTAVAGGTLEVMKALGHLSPACGNAAWMRVAMCLHELGERGFVLFDEWSQACPEKYEGDKIRGRWDSIKDDKVKGVTLASLFHMAKEHGYAAPGASPHEILADFAPVQLVGDAPAVGLAQRMHPVALSLEVLRELPRRKWVVRNRLERGELTVAVAPGGVGKSLWTVAVAAAVALGDGRPFGLDVLDDGPVLFVSAEDRLPDFYRRIGALCLHHGIDPELLASKLIAYDATSGRLLLAERDGSGKSYRATAVVRELTDYIKAGGYAAVVFDPLVKLHALNENDNGEMNFVADILRKIGANTNAAIIAVHHTRKPSAASSTGFEGNADAGRGAGSIKDAARVVLTLVSMDAATAKAKGVPETERWRFVRVDDGKINHGPKSAAPDWFEKHSVTLPNGEDAPALAPAKFAEPALGATPAQTAAVLAEVQRMTATGEWQRYSSKARAKDFLPRQLAGQPAMAAVGISEQTATQALAHLVAAGSVGLAPHGRAKSKGETAPERWRATDAQFDAPSSCAVVRSSDV